MIPATLTLDSMLVDAGSVVSAFGAVIALVAGLSIGWAVVNWVVRKLRRAGR